jgi:hypothetical protein
MYTENRRSTTTMVYVLVHRHTHGNESEGRIILGDIVAKLFGLIVIPNVELIKEAGRRLKLRELDLTVFATLSKLGRVDW